MFCMSLENKFKGFQRLPSINFENLDSFVSITLQKMKGWLWCEGTQNRSSLS